MKEHIYHNNKIIEYDDGTFLSTKNVGGEVQSKSCKTLDGAKAFIHGKTCPRGPKFTRLTNLHEKDLYAVENLIDKAGKNAFCVLTEYGIFIVYEAQWEAFVKANKDFNSKSAIVYRAFDDLGKWSQYSKRQIKKNINMM